MMKSEKVFILAVFSMFLFSLSQAQISPPEQEKVLPFRTNQVLIAPDVPELVGVKLSLSQKTYVM